MLKARAERLVLEAGYAVVVSVVVVETTFRASLVKLSLSHIYFFPLSLIRHIYAEIRRYHFFGYQLTNLKESWILLIF